MSYKRVVITEFGDSDVLKITEEAILPEPQSGQVRVRVLTTSASFTGTMSRKGMYADIKRKLPFSPGYDMIGVVNELGEGATRFTVDKRWQISRSPRLIPNTYVYRRVVLCLCQTI